MAVLTVVLAACSGGSGGSAEPSGPSTTLRMALTGDLPTLDPGTVYQYEGNQVLGSVYEGLLAYASDSSSDIVPQLASSYEVSDDALTYTFTLRDDVTFASGATMTSKDVKASFERLADPKVESQMSYMVSGVESYETPDDTTFVVKLSAPSSSFLSLVASPFGPKVIDSGVLAEHADDSALEFLKTSTAGTGPYALKTYEQGQQYVLARNDTYWGDKPYFAEVSFKIIPDAATQVLQLQGGDLDVISGQPVATLDSFGGDDAYRIGEYATLQKAQLHMKVTGPLADAELRTALRSAIDRPALVEQGWNGHAEESSQMYPVDAVPEGTAADTWDVDTAPLTDLAAGKKLKLGYLADQAQDKQIASTLQAQWQSAGADVELVPVQTNDVYSLSSDLDNAPDMMFEASYPDSTHPDTWSRLFWYSDTSNGSGALNYLLGGDPNADALIDEGAGAVDQADIDAAYAAAADVIHDQASYVTLADVKDTFIMRSDITGDGHQLPCPRALDLRTLARS
jgi:peptide/nickel transport system substrate-binding protein